MCRFSSPSPLDNGASPDTTAGDGIFSTLGRPGGKIIDLGEMTIRVGAKDSTNTIVLADTVLKSGPSGRGFRLSPYGCTVPFRLSGDLPSSIPLRASRRASASCSSMAGLPGLSAWAISYSAIASR
jgi:hypothetical protein